MSFICGFKVIQIHAAHGYFLSKFISASLNNRKDVFGKNRYLILEIIINKIRDSFPDALIDVRVSLLDGIKKTTEEIKEKSELLETLANMDIDMISVTCGMYDVNRKLMYPSTQDGHGAYIEKVLPFVSKYSHKIWNVAGNIWDLKQLSLSLPKNLSFSIARSLIADPNFVEKSINGDHDSINACIRSGICHYYTRGSNHVSCPVYAKQKVLNI
jgi:2,4-dienoyl-CoA reductase-like NADH-dependent reductase (Old Yellow Enzyme family)